MPANLLALPARVARVALCHVEGQAAHGPVDLNLAIQYARRTTVTPSPSLDPDSRFDAICNLPAAECRRVLRILSGFADADPDVAALLDAALDIARGNV